MNDPEKETVAKHQNVNFAYVLERFHLTKQLVNTKMLKCFVNQIGFNIQVWTLTVRNTIIAIVGDDASYECN